MKRITIILVLTIITSFSLTAQTTYVPDDNFEQTLINQGLDDVLDDYVATVNIENLITLDVRFESISDLTGIEDFSSLTQLKCTSNNLTSLDLSNNPSLEKLYANSNQLTNIDLSQNIELTTLYVANNLLTHIDIGNNILLTNLYCENNHLTDLGLSTNPDLESLICYDNQLTSLDLSNNSDLVDFRCFDNLLTSLDLRNGANTNITVFNSMTNSDLTCIFVDDVAYSTANWTDIDPNSTFVADDAACDAIRLTYVPDDNFEQELIDQGLDDVLDDYVATVNIENLTTLDVINRNIADLTGIEDFTAITKLYCGNNNLTSIDVSNNSFLEELHSYTNGLISIDVSQNLVLRKLNVGENSIFTIDVSSNTALTLLWCQYNQISSLDLTSNPNLLQFRCYDNQLTSLDLRNGANTNITDYNSILNPDLTCIFVDDVPYSTANWTDIDAASTFVTTEAECDAVLGVDDVINNAFMIYPNPVKDSFSIQTELDIIAIEIYDVFGKLVKTANATNSVSISQLHTGIYLVRINTSNGVGIHRIIKK